ncbi:hypothetical protein MMC20_000419 [Loxospora ochrophaea]|nr:hypothetical protein [Loxospora ochrophaea]
MGVHGVNLPVDAKTTRGLWTSIGIICMIVLCLRLTKNAIAHLRHLSTLGRGIAAQQYWSIDHNSWWPNFKKHLLYAPIWKKRHNRELQLSKAINMGTLPSRLHAIILIFYFLSNVVYCLALKFDEKNHSALLAEVRGRTGHLSVINMLGLILLAGRNNPLIPLLRVSFDTCNLFHRWIGRIVILEALAHTFAWLANEIHLGGGHAVAESLATSPFCRYGLVGTIAMTIIMFQAPSAIRHAFYETFLHIHQILAAIAIIAVWVHIHVAKLPQRAVMDLVVIFWLVERCVRWVRIVYRNVSRQGCTRVTVEALPCDACRVSFEVRRPWKYSPGAHVYAYLPSVSFWMSHPFSIAWCEDSSVVCLSKEEEKSSRYGSSIDTDALPTRATTTISLIMAKRTGMTGKLYEKALKAGGTLKMYGAIEGPYSGYDSLQSYGTVMLFAGGVGITHQLSFVRQLVAGFSEGTIATRKVILVWVVRSNEQLEWIRPWMNEILGMPGRTEVLKILLFVTKPNSLQEIHSQSRTVQMFPGRPNPKTLVAMETKERIGAMVITACGPGPFTDDVRDAARMQVGEGSVDFIEESFTW